MEAACVVWVPSRQDPPSPPCLVQGLRSWFNFAPPIASTHCLRRQITQNVTQGLRVKTTFFSSNLKYLHTTKKYANGNTDDRLSSAPTYVQHMCSKKYMCTSTRLLFSEHSRWRLKSQLSPTGVWFNTLTPACRDVSMGLEGAEPVSGHMLVTRCYLPELCLFCTTGEDCWTFQPR